MSASPATDITSLCDAIDRMSVQEITPIARSAMRDDDCSVVSWTATPMMTDSIGIGTIGFVHVRGTTSTSTSQTDWSAVVKAMEMDGADKLGGVQGIMASPTREVGAFESGFLEQLDGDLRAVSFHGITRIGKTTLLWMDDLSDSAPHPWGTDEFLAASRQTGYFNGSWPESRAPEFEWLDRNFVTNRPAALIRSDFFEQLNDPSADDAIADLTERSGTTRISGLYGGYRTITESLIGLPKVVCHNDLHARNAFIRYQDQKLRTYVIDWASVGLGPAGLDGGTIIGGATNWREDETLLIADIEDEIFNEYLFGLQDAEFKHDRDSVRLGFLSNFVPYLWYYVIASIGMPNGQLSQMYSKRFAADGDDLLDQFALRLRLFMPMFDEAVSLAKQLG